VTLLGWVGLKLPGPIAKARAMAGRLDIEPAVGGTVQLVEIVVAVELSAAAVGRLEALLGVALNLSPREPCPPLCQDLERQRLEQKR
jgi:hypothetical protein